MGSGPQGTEQEQDRDGKQNQGIHGNLCRVNGLLLDPLLSGQISTQVKAFPPPQGRAPAALRKPLVLKIFHETGEKPRCLRERFAKAGCSERTVQEQRMRIKLGFKTYVLKL